MYFVSLCTVYWVGGSFVFSMVSLTSGKEVAVVLVKVAWSYAM